MLTHRHSNHRLAQTSALDWKGGGIGIRLDVRDASPCPALQHSLQSTIGAYTVYLCCSMLLQYLTWG